jgi:hypothetical protein
LPAQWRRPRPRDGRGGAGHGSGRLGAANDGRSGEPISARSARTDPGRHDRSVPCGFAVACRTLRVRHARAGGLWELGSRRWLVERRRLGPLIRAGDRQAGLPLAKHLAPSVRSRGPVIACPSPYRRDGMLRSRPG